MVVARLDLAQLPGFSAPVLIIQIIAITHISHPQTMNRYADRRWGPTRLESQRPQMMTGNQKTETFFLETQNSKLITLFFR